MILKYLLPFLALIWEVLTDYRSIVIRRKPDNHKADLLPRYSLCAVSAIVLYFVYGVPGAASFICSVCLFTALFDPIMGLLLHRDPLYKSPDAKWDQFVLQNSDPPAEVFVRLILIGIGTACFFYWNVIIGKEIGNYAR